MGSGRDRLGGVVVVGAVRGGGGGDVGGDVAGDPGGDPGGLGGVAAVRYRTIVADPPWPQGATGVSLGTGSPTRGLGFIRGETRRIDLPYATMTLDAIAGLPVREQAATDAHLYLWTTQKFLRDSWVVAEAWGFTVSATLVWCKQPTGLKMGGAFPASLEFIQFCRRGKLAAIGKADKRWWEWPRRRGANPATRGASKTDRQHSAKPEAFLDIVEQVSPGPYLELFARRARFGWDYWGDQSLGTAEMAS